MSSKSESLIKLITLNCNGLAEKPKRNRVLDILSTYRKALICLQEVHTTECGDSQHPWAGEWKGQSFWSGMSSRSAGVAILVTPDLHFKMCCQLIVLELFLRSTQRQRRSQSSHTSAITVISSLTCCSLRSRWLT